MFESQRFWTSDRDYVSFALQIDFPGKLSSLVNAKAFYERWNLCWATDSFRAKGQMVLEPKPSDEKLKHFSSRGLLVTMQLSRSLDGRGKWSF